jgi:hypothetical protein
MFINNQFGFNKKGLTEHKLFFSINDAALEDKDCENIYELVYHSHRQIAQAAGEFLNQKLFVKVENPVIEFRRGKKQSENSAFIQLLVQFLIESEVGIRRRLFEIK